MKIITWNMNWQKRNIQKITWDFLLNEVQPDIALLQELIIDAVPGETKNNVIARRSHTNKNHNANAWGTAIYVNPQIYKIETGKTVATKIKIKGKEIVVASIHIDTRSGDYSVGLNHLKSIFQNKGIVEMKNIIIGGDFNADVNYDNGYFDKNFFTLVLKDSNLPECEPKSKKTFFGVSTKTEIQDDHIYVSKELQGLVKKYDDKYSAFIWEYEKLKDYSDHTIVEINLTA